MKLTLRAVIVVALGLLLAPLAADAQQERIGIMNGGPWPGLDDAYG